MNNTVNDSQNEWDKAHEELEMSKRKVITEMREYLLKLCVSLPQDELEKELESIITKSEAILLEIRRAN